MQFMTDETFNENMMFFKVNYGLELDPEIKTPKAENSRIYARMLQDYLGKFPDEAVKKAFSQVMRKCDYLPKISHFAAELEPHSGNEAKAAWAEVLGMLHHNGGMRNEFWQTSGATAKAVEMLGGWGHLSQRSFYELNSKSLAEAFESAYNRAVGMGLAQKAAKVIGCRDKDWRTGEYLPLSEVKPTAALSALPEPQYLEESKDRGQDLIPVEYSDEIGGLARRKAMQ